MKKLDQATKYTVIICIGIALFNLIFGYSLTRISANAMRTLIDGRMLDVSNTAAAMLNGDDLEALNKDDYDSPEYKRVMQTLTYFQDNIELEYIYCIKQVGEREFVFSVDPTVEDPGEFGTPIVYTDALYNASKGQADVDDDPYHDSWGSFYSSYSPVFDSKGEVAGIVAADFSVDWYQNKIRLMSLIVGAFVATAFAFSILIAILIATQYKKYFLKLTDKMNELSNGIDTLINEALPGVDTREDSQITKTDKNVNMSDAMEVLGEKIGVMQMRLSRQIENIRSNAYVDALTGLNNRNSYIEYLQILEKKIAEDANYIFSVVVFDINQLKVINDDYGHDTGDRLIESIAGDIKVAFAGGRIYRVGGDEFVAILEEADLSDRIATLREIVARKNKEAPITHNPDLDIGVSLGCATYDPKMDRTYSEVFNRADDAMYADKREFYKTHEDRRKKR
ncbi:sensor domain-containing diguanylate cyclase [Butyrivibrio sp. CB08]|uniref:GGDEF domain-containing protein n=1 Tax=Butyrivibrio sp. CB08 TaxID=2364879 RepID=UPI000EA979EC|nr:diguanylate cyclase [Butyrivibrio sp. CB08]RKM61893.1 sensor domain-containing diguanylate cyclase [Butyrivibrio sp. CB08]